MSPDVIKDCLQLIPFNRLIISTNSPNNTPQNIPDAFMRQQRNEPSNLPFCYSAIYELLHRDNHPLSLEAFKTIVKDNFLELFSLSFEFAALSLSLPSVSLNVKNEPSMPVIVEPKSALHAEDSSNLIATEEVVNAAEKQVVSNSNNGSIKYACMRCRVVLFRQCDTVSHSVSDLKTVFKVISYLFVLYILMFYL